MGKGKKAGEESGGEILKKEEEYKSVKNVEEKSRRERKNTWEEQMRCEKWGKKS